MSTSHFAPLASGNVENRSLDSRRQRILGAVRAMVLATWWATGVLHGQAATPPLDPGTYYLPNCSLMKTRTLDPAKMFGGKGAALFEDPKLCLCFAAHGGEKGKVDARGRYLNDAILACVDNLQESDPFGAEVRRKMPGLSGEDKWPSVLCTVGPKGDWRAVYCRRAGGGRIDKPNKLGVRGKLADLFETKNGEARVFALAIVVSDINAGVWIANPVNKFRDPLVRQLIPTGKHDSDVIAVQVTDSGVNVFDNAKMVGEGLLFDNYAGTALGTLSNGKIERSEAQVDAENKRLAKEAAAAAEKAESERVAKEAAAKAAAERLEAAAKAAAERLAATEASKWRTWTSTSGSTLDAKLSKVIGDTVYLEKRDGSVIHVRRSQLIEADQKWIKMKQK